MNSNIDKRSRDEIYKKIAQQLLKEVLNEDLSTIVNRDKIFEVFRKISTQQDDKNYLLVHTKLQNNLASDQSFQGDDIIEMLMKNNEKLYNQIYQKIKSEFIFEIELHKYGRKVNSIRKRWAYILYPDTFASTIEPFLINMNKKKPQKFKNKNYSLENMRNIIIQQYTTNLKDYKADKIKNPVRIAIEFIDINKNNRTTEIFLYFENMIRAKETYDLLMLMRMWMISKKNSSLALSLNSLLKTIEPAHKYVLMKKIIDVKNIVKAKKLADLEKNKLPEDDKNIDLAKPSKQIVGFANANKFTLGTKFENLLVNIPKKEENILSKFNTLATFRAAKDTLRKVFLEKLKSKNPKKYLHSSPAAYIHNVEEIKQSDPDNKKTRFKIKKGFVEGGLGRSRKMNSNTFSAQNLEICKDLAINTKHNEINFGNFPLTSLISEDILEINSVYLNLNEKGAYEQNSILINGPKKDLNKFFSYRFNKLFVTENNLMKAEELIEPEFHGLRLEQNFTNKFSCLILQVFHASIYLPISYLNYLEKKNYSDSSLSNNFDINNNNKLINGPSSSNILNMENNSSVALGSMKFSNPLTDFYYYISFNINNKFFARTKLFKGLIFENENLFIEFNNQIILNREQIALIKNFQMKISINLIPSACLQGEFSDVDISRIFQDNSALNEPFMNRESTSLRFRLDNFIENFRPHEVSYCVIDNESLNGKKNEFILKNNFLEFNNPDSYVVLNIVNDYKDLLDKTQLTKFNCRDFSIGQEIYFLIEYTKDDFTKILKDSSIPEDIKERFYNVEFDKEDHFLLRPHIYDHKAFAEVLASNNPSKDETELIMKSIKNSKYKYLPKCEAFSSIDNLSKSNNLYLNKKYFNNSCTTSKNIIYRLKKISKYSLCKILGIGYNSNIIILKDLFLGKVFTVSYLDLLTRKTKNFAINSLGSNSSISSNLSSEKQLANVFNDFELTENYMFRNLQENSFSIYDFDNIDLGAISNKNNNNNINNISSSINNALNHNWNLCLKFYNKMEMDAFLYFLKQLRRNANFSEKSKQIISTSIDTKYLIHSLNKYKSEFKRLNIMIEKVEFKKDFKLQGTRKMQINLLKGAQFRPEESQARNLNHNRSIFELLEDGRSNKFSNSLLSNKEIKQEQEFYKNSKSKVLQMPAALEFNNEKLAKINHQVKFAKISSSSNTNSDLGYEYKLFEVNASPLQDKVFTLQVLFALNDNSPISIQDEFNFFSEADIANVLIGDVNADFVRLPLYSSQDKSIKGMVDIVYWVEGISVRNLAKELQFNNIFNSRFRDINTIRSLLIDEYGNNIPREKINPNIFKRKILRTITETVQQDINYAAQKILTETDGAVKNKLIKCLYNKGVLGYENLITADRETVNAWRELIPDMNFLYLKSLRKLYVKIKKRVFYDAYRIEEWRNYFKKSKASKVSGYTGAKDVSFSEHKQSIIDTFQDKERLIGLKKENSEEYFNIKKFVEIGIPENMRLFVWDTILGTEKICFKTIEALKENQLNPPIVMTLNDKKGVYQFFEKNVLDNKKFNINFSYIDNDLNYLDRDLFSKHYSDYADYTEATPGMMNPSGLDSRNNNNNVLMQKISERNNNLKKIRNICKAYFLWTDLNLKLTVSENLDKMPRKYIYFFGMLEIIKTLLSVFKEEYIVFWLLIGLSQNIELFYQSNPLLSNQLNYSKVYIIITKVRDI